MDAFLERPAPLLGDKNRVCAPQLMNNWRSAVGLQTEQAEYLGV